MILGVCQIIEGSCLSEQSERVESRMRAQNYWVPIEKIFRVLIFLWLLSLDQAKESNWGMGQSPIGHAENTISIWNTLNSENRRIDELNMWLDE